jgi:DivIVA domain-containing protein
VGVLVLEIVVAAVVVFVVAAVAMGYGGSITHFAPDWPGGRLPEGRAVRPDDVTHLRFSLAFRGYRMSEVDDTLDRLATEIAERDARIEQLTGRPYEAPTTETNETVTDETIVAPFEPAPFEPASSESHDPADPNAAL